MAKPKNLIVAQSGGPTPVINNSLRGIIDACREYSGRLNLIYAGYHGVEGILNEDLLDLTHQAREEIDLLRTTPASGSIGTCRYKLKKEQNEDYERIIEVLKAHAIGYLVYIGGNDSMDTAHKISQLAQERNLDLVVVGVPKTIDNDVGDSEFKLIDHTPGYGSVARYWSCLIQNANEENAGSSPSDPVLVIQAMGRKIGFIPAAARLADPDRHWPLQIYMAESRIGLTELADNVNDQLKRSGRVIVVVSEGMNVADLGVSKDSFGHIQFSASQMTAAQKITNYLNEIGLKAHGAARCQVPGTDQRDAIPYASVVDLDEAYKLGQKAVEIAAASGDGYMSTILRKPGFIYNIEYNKVPLQAVANSERFFPEAWIAPNRVDVTDDFIRYAKPLMGEDWVSVPMQGGVMRFARLKPLFAEKKLPAYVPQAYRPR